MYIYEDEFLNAAEYLDEVLGRPATDEEILEHIRLEREKAEIMLDLQNEPE